MFNQEVMIMAKNYSSENRKNKSGASNSRNTFVENCSDSYESNKEKNAQNSGKAKNKNTSANKNTFKSEY